MARYAFGRAAKGAPVGRLRHEALLLLSLSTFALRVGGAVAYLRDRKRGEERNASPLPAVLLIASLFTEALAMAVGITSTARNRQWRWLACVAAFGTLATTPYALLDRGGE